jgi:hypothetical protein
MATENTTNRPPQTKRNLSELSIAYHEAGHAVAAYFLHIPFGKKFAVSIIGDEESAGGVLHRNRLRKDDLILSGSAGRVSEGGAERLRAEKLAMFYMAGEIAQRKHNPRSVRSWHGSTDRRFASDVMSRLFGEGDLLRASLRFLRLRTEYLIETPYVWDCVVAVATAVLEKRILTGSEVTEIVARQLRGQIPSQQFLVAVNGPAGEKHDELVTTGAGWETETNHPAPTTQRPKLRGKGKG